MQSTGVTSAGWGASGTRPRPARGDVKAAGKLPGLDTSSQSKSQAKVVSTIEGDGMTVVPAPVTLTKQTESSPFRFAKVSRESGIDFVYFSGMTGDKYFPGQCFGRGALRLRRRS